MGDSSTGAGVACPQPGMKNALSLAQNGQQGVMAFTTGALRVVAFCRTLLAATALEDGIRAYRAGNLESALPEFRTFREIPE